MFFHIIILFICFILHRKIPKINNVFFIVIKKYKIIEKKGYFCYNRKLSEDIVVCTIVQFVEYLVMVHK